MIAPDDKILWDAIDEYARTYSDTYTQEGMYVEDVRYRDPYLDLVQAIAVFEAQVRAQTLEYASGFVTGSGGPAGVANHFLQRARQSIEEVS